MRYRTAFDDLFDVFNDFDEMFRRTFPEMGWGTPEANRLLPSGKGSALQQASPSRQVVGRTWFPPVESFVKDGRYHVRLELPGVDPSDVDISLTGDQLTITGEKKANQAVDENNVYFSESRYGRFHRSFRLPEGIKHEDVKATYSNGVLELSIPVPDEVRPKTVKIEVSKDPKSIKAA